MISDTVPRWIHVNDFDGVRYTWDVRILWTLSADLPVMEVPVGSIAALDQDCWFDHYQVPTTRNVLRHVRRILSADLSRPIILNVDGSVMDGVHRLARAALDGHATILAVQFATMPPAQKEEPVPPDAAR